MKTLKLTSNGRITIPTTIRKKYNLTPGRKIKLKVTEEGIVITPVAAVEEIRVNAGLLGMKGKMLESLMEEKNFECES
jgi:AbrB family looped-hinge helix DNA binding protein